LRWHHMKYQRVSRSGCSCSSASLRYVTGLPCMIGYDLTTVISCNTSILATFKLFEPVCIQLRTSAVNVTLPAFAAAAPCFRGTGRAAID